MPDSTSDNTLRIQYRVLHYWKKKLVPEIDRSGFTELTAAKDVGITIEYHHLRICLDKYFDPAALKQCLCVLMEIQC